PEPMPEPVKPAPTPPPAPEPPTETPDEMPDEAPSEAAPVPAPEPATEGAMAEAGEPEAVPTPPPTRPEEPAQAEESEAAPAQPMVPEPPAPPAPAMIPSPGRSELRSFTEASCPGCKTGEWALTHERNTAAGGAGCPRNTRDLEQALRDMAEAAGPNLASDPAPLAFSDTVPAEIAPYLDPAASCQLLAVSLPPETKYTGYRYAVRDANDGGDCQAGEECSLGEARWSGHPGLIKTDHGTVVWALFENSSRTQARQALFIVYLQPEQGWRPGGAP
ncbi:MAG: hypothetical protein SX243_21215, partial [Acidobacteriota bacterium]|nr:hypothetical protein [Acidobacteriota bacterium]